MCIQLMTDGQHLIILLEISRNVIILLNNCLHIAALYGHLNLCKFFLDNENFDVHMADNDG